MSTASAPTERTRLIDTDGNANESHGAISGSETGLRGIERQFEEALQEEAPGTSLFDILTNRPGAVIVALSLFALLVLATTWVSALKDPVILDKLVKVPQINPVSAELLEIGRHEIHARTDFSIVMDYNSLGDGVLRTVAEQLSQKFSSIALKMDGPISLSTVVEDDGEPVWKYVISVNVSDEYEVDIRPQSQQLFSIYSTLSEVGQTKTLARIVRQVLADEPVKFRAAGTAIVSKYGISLRLPFIVEDEFSIPQQTIEDLADIAKVEVEADKLHGLNITALVNATMPEFPVSCTFPDLSWEIKIPGCDEGKLEVLCEGKTMPFDLSKNNEILNVFFSSIVDNLPLHLTQACDPENENSISPLDRWVTAYLAGQLSTFHVRAIPRESQPPILNELITGYDVPCKVYGKPATEKLIQSVSIEEVRFSSQSQMLSDTMRFNGKAVVDVVLPSFMEMKTKTALVVNGVKGTVQLFDENKNHFAQILAGEKWMQTISLGNDEGYKVVCFFDNLPTEITDNAVFAEVSRDILLVGKATINYDAVVDVNFETPVGAMIIKKIRIKGTTEMRT